jgi:hypothetical protein
MIDNDIKNLIQDLAKSGQTWQKEVVIAMYLEIERLRKLLNET